MTTLGPHAVFIIAAYGFTLIVITALIIGIFNDTRAQKRTLASLEARGIGRRNRKEA